MIRWDYGKVYKEIRKSKGITQEEICGDTFARSTLTRIEGGNVIPKFETMIFLLNQIDMTLDEFEYICNYYYPTERREILNDIQKINSRIIPISELENLKERCQNYLRKNHDLPMANISDTLQAHILFRKSGMSQTSSELNSLTMKIWNYLEKQDTWYFSDLRLLSNILYHFPFEHISKITHKILESLIKYSDYRDIKGPQFTILINPSTLYLHHNQIAECRSITLWALELAQELKRFDFLGMSQVRLGICQQDDDLIEKGLAILRLTDETELLAMLEKEVADYRHP